MNIKKFILLILFTILLLELCSYIASKKKLLIFNKPPGYLQYKTEYSASDWRSEEEAWGAWHKKNFSTRHKKKCFDVTYNSNDVGARSSFSFNNLKDKNNLILLGDSFAEGTGVKEENILASQLTQNYKKSLNFGSGGNFGPLQSFIIYRDLAKKFTHNEVVFLFLPANDFHDNDFEYYKKNKLNNRYRPYIKKIDSNNFEFFYPEGSTPQKDFPYENVSTKKSDLIKTILKEYTWLYNSLKTIKYSLLQKKNLYTVDEKKFGYFFDDEYFVDGTIFFIGKLFDQVDSEFKKSLLIIPTERDLINILEKGTSYKELNWYKKLELLSKKYDFKIIDLALNYKNEYSSEFIKNGLENWYLKCDGHWNKNGHKLAEKKFLLSK